MKQTIAAVVEVTTKNTLEAKAKEDGLTLSKYVGRLLTAHARELNQTAAKHAELHAMLQSWED